MCLQKGVRVYAYVSVYTRYPFWGKKFSTLDIIGLLRFFVEVSDKS